MTIASEVLAEARAATGLEDFGPADFLEGLEIYCESAFDEAQLSDLGVMAVRGTIVASLINRLNVVDWVTRHPDVTRERIDAPLIVVGMFRAGTTLLSRLLAEDAGNRALLRWEAGDSAPPPTPETARSGPRVDAARAGTDMLDQLNPKMRAIHHEEADGPTECIAVMSQDFKSLSWEAITNVPSYGRWLREVDQRSAYAYHKVVLQTLQSGGVGGRWTLKSPHHALALDALVETYPDAKLVVLHRDPTILLASACSLISTLSGTFSEADHTRYIAEHWLDVLETSIDRIAAFRETHPDHPVIDVQYDDLVREPVKTTAGIYESVGDYLGDEARAAIESYVGANARGKFGSHRYELTEFGLERAAITERFGDYVTRYGIPMEGQP